MMHSRPMMEARLAYIKVDLEITESQSDVWNAYSDSVRASHAAMQDVRKTTMEAKEAGDLIDRMGARIRATEGELDSLETLKPKVEALYTELTDDQRKKADKVLADGCGMM